MTVRVENDLLGFREIPADVLYGIHTVRALENFSLSGRRVPPELIHAFGAVKLAAARVNRALGAWDETKFSAIERACREMMAGQLDAHIVVDALQGGAGTSTNMNVNEVLANRALQLLGRPLGDYATISPMDDINRHQSTNDTFPTAVRVAALWLLARLEREVVSLQEAFQAKEKQFADVVKIGRTQLQDAVLTTLGREMSAYAEAFNRDRWRIYKCTERLRVVNLGGTAIGTGLAAPRQYIFRVVDALREIVNLPLARAENLVEATQNCDVFVEVCGILKAHAANLLKVATDLRLLSSGPTGGFGEIRLPARQAGSSIMPAKVNPVIPEAVSQAAIMVFANESAVAHAAASGNLELNAFLPLIADRLFDSLDLLTRACDIFRRLCVEGIEADEARCRANAHGATALLTAVVERIGHDAADAIARLATETGASVRELLLSRGLLSSEELDQLTSAEGVTRLGSK